MAVPSPVPLVGTPEPDAETASNANGTGSTTDIAESPSNATPVPTSSAATTPQTQPADTPEAREEKQPADDKLDVKPDPQFVQSQILVQELELQSQSQSELQLEIQPKADGKPVPPLPQAQNHPRIAAMPPAPPSKPAPSIQAQKARERRRKKALAKAEAAAATAVHPQYCDACGMDPIIGIRFACIECAALEIFVDLCSGCAAKGFTNGGWTREPSDRLRLTGFNSFR